MSEELENIEEAHSAMDLWEAIGTIKRKRVVRDGRRITIKKREYSTQCKEGYKRDTKTGKCIKMSADEKRNRSRSSKRTSRKSSTIRKRNISNKRR